MKDVNNVLCGFKGRKNLYPKGSRKGFVEKGAFKIGLEGL